jgi:acetyl esterase/lipase
MPSRHLVDPEMAPLAEMPSLSFESVAIEQVRALMAATRPPLPPLPADVQVYEARTPGRDGAPDVRLVVTAPKATGQGRPGILHVHGGGFVLGSADMTGPTDAEYAVQLGAVVVSVDYRLAPETPYPGPVEDCYAALAWLHAQAAALGVDPGRVVVSGESAGGGLAAALVLLARHLRWLSSTWCFQCWTTARSPNSTPRRISASSSGRATATASAGLRCLAGRQAARTSRSSPHLPAPATSQPCRPPS